ncbi:alpha/beta hydrolase [Cohnella hashimotonis]|uniref:Alpha/beta hydrolase-fold protein n=1 Tax=Cohnella hashimotonis TaxID=2826895 RepID=A0ABT6TFR9_9BACL|nr:alpha/beta hydrolase-fold protein [Cohnella hashimotonis]MDI4645688.1 alpha/beta hydrolase-fold protein [Cohnella hashimotonis]
MSDSPVRRTVVKHTIPSNYLSSGERAVRFYFPPGYQEWLSYPVVYCQDGEDFFNFGRIATISHGLILEESWEPFIIAAVDVDKSVRTEEYLPGSVRHEAYLNFWTSELVPFVEKNFAARPSADARLLAGDSLGATVSLAIAIRRPDLFNRLLSLSGAYYGASIAQMKEAGDLSWLSAWMTVGLQETAYETERGTHNFVELNRAAKRILESKGAYVDYREKDGEHKWGFWQKELPEALGAFLGPKAHM